MDPVMTAATVHFRAWHRADTWWPSHSTENPAGTLDRSQQWVLEDAPANVHLPTAATLTTACA